MSLNPTNGALTIRPSPTWEYITSPVVAIYNFSNTTLSYCWNAAQYYGCFVQSYALSFFQTQMPANPIPKLAISENSIEQLHETKSLKGDSLTKQIQRDVNCMTVFIEGERQTCYELLRKNAVRLLQKVSKEEPNKECVDRVLRICQQAIFQPGFEALKIKLEKTHIVLQDTSIPLEVRLESNESTITAVGAFGVRIYPTVDFEEIDTTAPQVCHLKFKIPQVFSNQMTCFLEEISTKTLKKIQ